MTTMKAIADACANWEGETTINDAVCEWANCDEADVRADGSVWISGPQTGHWLPEDRLADLVDWLRSRRMI